MGVDDRLLPYPWHTDTMRVHIDADRLNTSVYLLHAPQGAGKKQFARAMIAQHLCRQGNGCGQCDACRMIMDDQHPDIWQSDQACDLKISDIREVIDQAHQASLLGRGKVLWLHDIDALSSFVANALLKLIEQPPKGMLIIMLTTALPRCRSTLVSRAYIIDLSCRDERCAAQWWSNQGMKQDQKPWLQLFAAQPCFAQRMAQDHRQQDVYQGMIDLMTSDALPKIMRFVDQYQDIAHGDIATIMVALLKWLINPIYDLPYQVKLDKLKVKQNKDYRLFAFAFFDRLNRLSALQLASPSMSNRTAVMYLALGFILSKEVVL